MGKKKKKSSNPFVNYTVEQIMMSEKVLYVIQVGRDVFEVDGQWFFSEKKANSHYKNILEVLLEQLNSGNAKQRLRASRALSSFKIHPLRMH